MSIHADVDIDFADRTRALLHIPHVLACLDPATGKPHNTGIYLQNIPSNPVTNVSTIQYKEADHRGYFKFDFLNVNIYAGIKSEEHLVNLMTTEPMWELLLCKEFSDLVFHLNGHSDILSVLKPQSVLQLAAAGSIIRPAKRYLLGQSWDIIFEEVWKKPTNSNEYYWKKSHAVAYATAMVVHINLLCEQLSQGASEI